MREILSDEQKRVAEQIAEEAETHFITSRREYEDTNPSIWDDDEEIIFDVPVEAGDQTHLEKKAERENRRNFIKEERKEIRQAKHVERSANHIIDKGIRAEKHSLHRDIKELEHMELQDKIAQIERTIKDKL